MDVTPPRPPPDPPNRQPEFYPHQFNPYPAPQQPHIYTDSYTPVRSPYAEPLNPLPAYFPPLHAYSYHQQPYFPIATAAPQELYTNTDLYTPLQYSYSGYHQLQHEYQPTQILSQPPLPRSDCPQPPPQSQPPSCSHRNAAQAYLSPVAAAQHSTPTYTNSAIPPTAITQSRSCPEQPATAPQPAPAVPPQLQPCPPSDSHPLSVMDEKNHWKNVLSDVVVPKSSDVGIGNCIVFMKKKGHQPDRLINKAKKTGFSFVSMILLEGYQHLSCETIVEGIATSPHKEVACSPLDVLKILHQICARLKHLHNFDPGGDISPKLFPTLFVVSWYPP